MKTINIAHLYPKEMNIYGDNGNLLVFVKRLEWRKLQFKVANIGIGDVVPADTHFIIGGGGQDAGQSVIAEDLQNKKAELTDMANSGIPMLMICGMYQMFGYYFKMQNGDKLPGIGILDVYTQAEQGRLIGNLTVKTEWGDIVGYENHSGRTYIGNKAKHLGLTAKGCGNNGKDLTEGAVQKNVFGSYLHGPMLAKSPKFCDHLIGLSLSLMGYSEPLEPLNDKLELLAADVAKTRKR